MNYSVESLIGIISGLITIGLAIPIVYNYLKTPSVYNLMKKLVDKNLSTKEHQKILRKLNRRISLFGKHIEDSYIRDFVLNERGIEAVFMDICEKNRIEPTKDICVKFLGADMPRFRTKYNGKGNDISIEENAIQSFDSSFPSSLDNEGQIVYMSELLMVRHPETCGNLIKIFEKHKTNYSFIKGTKDIWCRDYMPVQTVSGKLIQFKYDPSYLKGKKEYEESCSDVREVCRLNNIKPQFSDINLDGGNVLICEDRAIISDRIFEENPTYDKNNLINELSRLLECEIIIIPSLRSKDEDFTGHADGMVRFVDRNTIVGNNRASEYKYWQNGMEKVLNEYKLTYIDIPCIISKKDPEHPDSAIGIYVNFLDVNDLIVLPVFGKKEDKEAIDILQKTFPSKIIETINYNDIAFKGGLLNCTTWVVNPF